MAGSSLLGQLLFGVDLHQQVRIHPFLQIFCKFLLRNVEYLMGFVLIRVLIAAVDFDRWTKCFSWIQRFLVLIWLFCFWVCVYWGNIAHFPFIKCSRQYLCYCFCVFSLVAFKHLIKGIYSEKFITSSYGLKRNLLSFFFLLGLVFEKLFPSTISSMNQDLSFISQL